MTTFRGRRTAKRRGARRLSTSRTTCSSCSISTTASLLLTPTSVANSRMPSAGKPRRRKPAMVGMRGSSQPRTRPSSTRRSRKRLESTVQVRLSRANSYWCGRGGHGQVLDEPVVERAVVLELKRADGVRDALDGIRLAVREVVGGVDAPGIAGARVRGVQDAVEDGIAQVEVGRRHVDAGPQDAGAVGELAGAHAREEVQVLLDRAAAPGAIETGLRERAAVLADLIGGQVVDVGQPVPDQVDGPFVELLEVVRGVVEVLAPVEAQPAHVGLDGVDVLLLLLGGVGVVEAQVAAAAELAGDAEVEADRLGVADVQVAVGLRREARHDGGVPPAAQVVGHDVADEVAALGGDAGVSAHTPPSVPLSRIAGRLGVRRVRGLDDPEPFAIRGVGQPVIQRHEWHARRAFGPDDGRGQLEGIGSSQGVHAEQAHRGPSQRFGRFHLRPRRREDVESLPRRLDRRAGALQARRARQAIPAGLEDESRSVALEAPGRSDTWVGACSAVSHRVGRCRAVPRVGSWPRLRRSVDVMQFPATHCFALPLVA